MLHGETHCIESHNFSIYIGCP